MKLQEEQYYTKNFKIEDYTKAQVSRHNVKLYKKRVAGEYKICAEQVRDLVSSKAKMLCLGTRNNYERDTFLDELCVDVFSQDIAAASNANYIGDFNKLSELVPHDWDVIYSNSIDHATDPTKVFFEWVGVLNVGGIMLLGFSFDEGVGPSDCSSFSETTVDGFMKNDSDIYEYIKSFDAIDYKYWVIRRKA